jgi:hypothetical protein
MFSPRQRTFSVGECLKLAAGHHWKMGSTKKIQLSGEAGTFRESNERSELLSPCVVNESLGQAATAPLA